MRTTVSSKGQVVLPAEFRHQDNIQPGQEFEVERLDAGEYILKRRAPVPNLGLIDLLFSAPVKGDLEAIASESTDSLWNS
jgi:AbrB family looped-hinge helix DNA binding protein